MPALVRRSKNCSEPKITHPRGEGKLVKFVILKSERLRANPEAMRLRDCLHASRAENGEAEVTIHNQSIAVTGDGMHQAALVGSPLDLSA